jgi:hypothetical protein
VSIARQVLDEIAAGTPTVAAIAQRTGLDRGLVELAVGRLAAAGRLDVEPLAVGCPSGGCGTCPSGVQGTPGCGLTPLDRRGGILITLAARPS